MDLLHEFAIPFFRLGTHHIATGWDHLAFLLGLLLFRQPLGRVVWVVTAFTLAHSLTLGLAVAGWVRAPGALVEPLIALSIVCVGAMALIKPGFKHGPGIAFGFGLVHGLGFAGALGESLGEIQGAGWLVALAFFNAGIEALQLVLVALAYAVLQLVDRSSVSVLTRRALASGVAVMGLWWTAQRMLLLPVTS